MASLAEIAAVYELLSNQLYEDEINASCYAEHDIIYLPIFEEDHELADQLYDLGCHWDKSVGSWAMFT